MWCKKRERRKGFCVCSFVPALEELVFGRETPSSDTKTCDQLGAMITGLNLADGGLKRKTLDSSMALPLARSEMRSKEV
jgi:hypothetical protein